MNHYYCEDLGAPWKDQNEISGSDIEDLEMSCFTGSYVTGTVNQEYLNWVENEYKS